MSFIEPKVGWRNSIQLLFIGLAASFVLAKALAADPLDLMAIALAALLWKPGQSFVWAWPLGFGLAFYGKNPSFYQSIPYDTYLASVVLAELSVSFYAQLGAAHEAKPVDDGQRMHGYYWLVALSFAVWVALRAVPLLPLLVADYRQWGLREAIRTLSLAHAESPALGLRTALSWLLGLGLAYCLKGHRRTSVYFASGLIFGGALALVSGLRPVVVGLGVNGFCRGNLYCLAFLASDYAPNDPRIMSFFGNPGWYGQYLILLVPLILFFTGTAYRRGNKVQAVGLAVLAGLGVVEAVLCKQRATWLAMGVMFVMELCYQQRQLWRLENWKKRWLGFGLIAAVCLASAFVLQASIPWIAGKFHANLGGRAMVWTLLPELVAARPVLGHGTGGFGRVFAEAVLARKPGSELLEGAHNALFQVLIENGSVGVLLLLATLGVALRCLWRVRYERAAWYCLLALVGLAVNSLAQEVFYARSVLYGFWALIGIIFCLANPKVGAAHDDAVIARNAGWLSRKYRLVRAVVLPGVALIAAFAPAPNVEGCYSKEKDGAGFYRWCRHTSLWRFSPRFGMVSLRVTPVEAGVFHAKAFGGAAMHEFEQSMEAAREKEFEFVRAVKPSGPLTVALEGGGTGLSGDHRQLSYRIRMPEARSKEAVAATSGAYGWETNGEVYWRWTGPTSELLVTPETSCKQPALTVKADPALLTRPSVAVRWTRGAQSGAIQVAGGEVGFIPLEAAELNKLHLDVEPSFNPAKEGLNQDTRDLGVKIIGLSCQDKSS